MTQLSLSIAVDTTAKSKNNCWYCKEKKKGDNKSYIKKGRNFRARKDKVDSLSKLSWYNKRKYKWVSAEGHHLIAGKPMLAIEGIHKYILSEKGHISEDIGYDINHPNNLLWMPGRFDSDGISVSLSDTQRIALIKESKTQIHNSGHPKYRSNVREILTAIIEKLSKKKKKIICPICEKELSKKNRPPFGLVGRLDFASIKLRKLLIGKPSRWKLDNGYYTFSYGLLAKVKVWIKQKKI